MKRLASGNAILAAAVLAGAGLLPNMRLLAADAAVDTRTAPRNTRHALIIGIGEYQDAAIPPLKGVRHDMESATRMAAAMAIPSENIRYVRDRDATAARIEQEIAELNMRIQPGDRVFLYYSGHGTRWYDAAINKDGCVEALMAADSRSMTNQRIAALLKPVSDKTDKLMVFYDACHSGGIAGQPLKTRAIDFGSDKLTPKFSGAGAPGVCSQPVNIKTRGFPEAALSLGGLPQNFVQISSSRPDEISFDDEKGGGLATQAWRDCMLSEARDLDGSGAISVDEIAVCAQTKLEQRFTSSTQYGAPHITLGGNKAFIPAWFAAAPVQPEAPVAPPAATLSDIHAQRDARRTVSIQTGAGALRIGKDMLELSVTSSHDGFVYLVLLGSDNKSFYMLFPNDIDRNNAIKAGETLKLPRKDWQITAQGPAGTDKLLAIVSESARDLSRLGSGRTGPFLQTLTDRDGRANLQWLLGTSINLTSSECSSGGQRNLAIAKKCSDAFGTALIDIVEK